MSQWGEVRTFNCGKGSISVASHVATKTFSPITTGALVDVLVLLNIENCTVEQAHRKLRELRGRYVNQPYRKWMK